MKKYTQFGTFSIIAMLAAFFFCAGMLFVIGFDEVIPIIIFGFIMVTLIICLLIFYKLTITIDDTYLNFKLGIGLIRRSFRLSDIKSCTPVRNSAIWGIGIRMIPSGWLYNISGLSAIELSFKNRKTKIRIGTDQPEEVAEAVREKISGEQAGSFYETGGRQGIYLAIALLTVIIFIPVMLIFFGSREPEFTFSDSSLTISGMYELTIGYADIIRADTLQKVPKIKARTNGFAAGKVLKGNFKLYDQSKVILFIRKGVPPYILIQTTGTTIYLNTGDPGKTKELFTNIKERTANR